jgi:hypothetical protein
MIAASGFTGGGRVFHRLNAVLTAHRNTIAIHRLRQLAISKYSGL